MGEKKTREMVKVKWNSVSLPSDAVEVDDLPWPSQAIEQPIVLYFYSIAKYSKKSSSSKKPPKLYSTKSAKECESLANNVFNGKDKKVGILSRFYKCYEVDLSKMDPKSNKLFNETNAPFVLVFDIKGKLAANLKGSFKASSFYSALKKGLRDTAINPSKIVPKAESILVKIKDLENLRSKYQKRQDDSKKKLAKAKKKSDSEKYAKEIKDSSDKLVKIKDSITKGESLFYEMLTMPKED